MRLPSLNLPDFDLRIRDDEGGQVWDELRKKFVLLTPEEWVRQNFWRFLHDYLGYPKTMMKVEGSTVYNQRKKRPDIVIYDNNGQVAMIVECKAADVKINQKTFDQAAVYGSTMKPRYLVVTNGRQHFCCLLGASVREIQFVKDIPSYDVLRASSTGM